MKNDYGIVVVTFKYSHMEEVEYVNIKEVSVDHSKSSLVLRNSEKNLCIHIDLDCVSMFAVSGAKVLSM